MMKGQGHGWLNTPSALARISYMQEFGIPFMAPGPMASCHNLSRALAALIILCLFSAEHVNGL